VNISVNFGQKVSFVANKVVNSVNTSVADGDGFAVEKVADVDGSGQPTGNYTIRYKVKLGTGLSFDGNGQIELPGIATACNPGTGLSWDSAKSTFGCTSSAAAYSWTLLTGWDSNANQWTGSAIIA
jgi:hypothetical protein